MPQYAQHTIAIYAQMSQLEEVKSKIIKGLTSVFELWPEIIQKDLN